MILEENEVISKLERKDRSLAHSPSFTLPSPGLESHSFSALVAFSCWVFDTLVIINREFKKLRRLLQRKRHIKVELCIRLSILRLFHVHDVDHVVQNRRTALSLAWHEWFSCKGKEWKIYCCELALMSEPQIWKFHVVVLQTTSKHCTKKRAARLFFLHSTNIIIDLGCCRWRCCRQILNSLMKWRK